MDCAVRARLALDAHVPHSNAVSATSFWRADDDASVPTARSGHLDFGRRGAAVHPVRLAEAVRVSAA